MNEAPLGEAGHDVDKLYVRKRSPSAPPMAELSRKRSQTNGVSLANSGTLIHPSPLGGVYRSGTGINVPDATALWNLLHLEQAKAVVQDQGAYDGPRLPLTYEDFCSHLAGNTTLAFMAVRGNKALFAVLDADALFRELLPIFVSAIGKTGGEDLLNACLCTNGSDGGRGKVIVTFVKPVAASGARKLVTHLARLVRATEVGDRLGPSQFSTYPQGGEGGLVRILGRNIARNGPVETVFSLETELGISHVRPLSARRLHEIIAAVTDKTPAWVKRYVEIPWTRSMGGGVHFGRLLALARCALWLYGIVCGKAVYGGWCDRIKSNSPDLDQPSIKNGDRRNSIDHCRENAWNYAVQKPTTWQPQELAIVKSLPTGVSRTYDMFVSFVRENGLNPGCFAIDYERIAVRLDCSKSSAHRWVKRTAKLGLLVVHDRGSRHEKGTRGRCTSYGLVCFGETPELVIAREADKAASTI